MQDDPPALGGAASHDPMLFPWERAALREALSRELQNLVEFPNAVVVVPENVAAKIEVIHPRDAVYLFRLSDIIARWALAGRSPKTGAGGPGG